MPAEGMGIFDRDGLRRQRERAAAGLDGHDFLFREVAERLADRLDDIKRKFPLALDLGCHSGQLARALGGRGGIETLASTDLSQAMAAKAPSPRLVADEERLPFQADSLDLVLSNLSLHWVNDLPGTLWQINRALKPDGLFLAAMLGGETLAELREALLSAESALLGGASPRVSPFVALRDAGHLLQRAGFALPVVDADTLTFSYPDALALMRELKALGEANQAAGRTRGLTSPQLLAAAAAIYHERFADDAGRIPATFQVLYLTGWAPGPGQPEPLKPGSARASLAAALDGEGGSNKA